MTHILKIFEPTKEDVGNRDLDLDSILSRIDALEDGPARPSRQFAGLVDALTQRYPDITSAAAEALPESEWAWSDGPLDAGIQDTVLVLGLRTARMDEVQPFVIEQATARGLVVVDVQAGAAWLPGNVRLGEAAAPRANPPAGAKDRMPKCGEAALLLFDALAPALCDGGFKPTRSRRRFRRILEAGWQEIILMAQDYRRGACGFSLIAPLRIHAVSELHARMFLPAMPVKDQQALHTLVLQHRAWAPPDPLVGEGVEYRDDDPAQLAQLPQQVVADCTGRLLPLLDAARTVEGLDRLLNTDPPHRSVFFTGYSDPLDVHVWTAYLARNPRLESICDTVLQRARGDQSLHVARRCVDYVRAHPLP